MHFRNVLDKNIDEEVEEEEDDDLGLVRLNQAPIIGLDITQLFFCQACNIKGLEKSVKNNYYYYYLQCYYYYYL